MQSKDTESLDALESFEAEQKEKGKKSLMLAGAGGVVLLLIGGGFALSGMEKNNNSGNASNKEEIIDSQIISDETSSDNTEEEKDNAKVNNKKEQNVDKINEDSIRELSSYTQEEWENKYFMETNPDELSDGIKMKYQHTSLLSSFNLLPSELNGYSNHLPPEDDYYAYLTKDEALKISGEYIERLLNPQVGGWSDLQYPSGKAKENFNKNLFKDMFTPEYWSKYSTTSPQNYFPIYADWNEDNYGMNNLSDATRWTGRVVNMQSTQPDFPEQTITVVADVEFAALNNNGTVITKTGRLALELVQPNQEGLRPLLINEAKLTIN